MEEEDKGADVSSEIGSTSDKAKPGEGNLLNTNTAYMPRLGTMVEHRPCF